MDFCPFSTKRDTKRFSNWFGMIPNDLETDFGLTRNSSDSLELNSNQKLSPGLHSITEYFYSSLYVLRESFNNSLENTRQLLKSQI